jgi:hypothetical protein
MQQDTTAGSLRGAMLSTLQELSKLQDLAEQQGRPDLSPYISSMVDQLAACVPSVK